MVWQVVNSSAKLQADPVRYLANVRASMDHFLKQMHHTIGNRESAYPLCTHSYSSGHPEFWLLLNPFRTNFFFNINNGEGNNLQSILGHLISIQ